MHYGVMLKMKITLALSITIPFLACCQKKDSAKNSSMTGIPTGWFAGEHVSNEILNDPVQITQTGNMNKLYGLAPGDSSHRLYSIPVSASIDSITSYFRVGEHGGVKSNVVASKVRDMIDLFGGRVVFADSAGLKILFEQKLSLEDLDRLKDVFSDEEFVGLGGEMYLSIWDGEGHLLSPVLENNIFHFWWD